MGNKKTILVTGAGGYVGIELTKQLLKNTDWHILAFSANSAKIKGCIEGIDSEGRIEYFGRSDICSDNVPWESVDVVVHLAFARKQIPQSELIDSLEYSKSLFKKARDSKVPAFINISSQGVYGSSEGLHNEQSVRCPIDFYSVAKAANEVVLDAVFDDCNTTAYTNIRLDSIAGNKNLIPTLVRQGIEDKLMKLMGGKQVFSLLDVRDAAAGIIALCNTDPAKWERAYNLGWNDRIYGLVEVAELTRGQLEKRGVSGIKISLEERDIVTYAGMDSTKFTALTGWSPRYTITDIIDAVIDDYCCSGDKKL